MTAYFVDSRATGANDGDPDGATGADENGVYQDAWQSIADIAVPAGTHTVTFIRGSGPYFCDNWNLEQNGTKVYGNFVTLTGAIYPNNLLSTYQWTASATVENAYYLELKGGGDPSLETVNCATINGRFQEESAEDEDNYQLYNGVKATHELTDIAIDRLGWGDMDLLGFSTVYIRTDGRAPQVYDVAIAQVTEVIDSNLRDTVVEDFILEYANARIINSRQSVGFSQTYRRLILKFSNDHAVEATGQGHTIFEYCLGWFTGHRFFSDTDIGDTTLRNCMSCYAHLFGIFGPTATAGTKTIVNCIDYKSFAGSLDATDHGYTLVENNNLWFPALTEGTAMNYPNDSDVVWQTTDATDVPASADTGISDLTALLAADGEDPDLRRVDLFNFDNCDLRLKDDSAAQQMGIAWWTSTGARPIDLDGEPVPDSGISVGPYQSRFTPFHPANL